MSAVLEQVQPHGFPDPGAGLNGGDPRPVEMVGRWSGPRGATRFDEIDGAVIGESLRRPTSIVYDPTDRRMGLALGGTIGGAAASDQLSYPLVAALGALYPEWLGDRAFLEEQGLRFAYVGGSMARGIASTDLAIALAEIGAMGMFGAAGLHVAEVAAAIGRLRAVLEPRGLPWGCNLIHSPGEPGLEDELVELYLRQGVRRVEASAFMKLTKPLVRYACTGLSRGPKGDVIRHHHLFAKISREEVAQEFLSPAPEAMISELVAEGRLTAGEAALAREVPVAGQVIVEADSGGHTDNRPLGSLFPVIAALRDRLSRRHGYRRRIHLGAAGGLGTPGALASAYAIGAAFVVLGSVHQAAVESGLSPDARALLAKAGPADVAMTASADMFEMGVKVQVLSRGTMMAVRGNQLYQVYRSNDSLEAIAPDLRANLESSIFRMPLVDVWEATRRFFSTRDPSQLERAARDPKHRMALVFRWYIGNSSRWPILGDETRRADYQIWCGPAMGAFNRWADGSFLEEPGARRVQQIALNLLEGAAAVTRAAQLRSYGLDVPPSAFAYQPQPLQL